MYIAEARGTTFRARLRRWYGRHGRDLPWRGTRDPYRILVSEVMLQQTPVARVRPAYDRFLGRFPTLGGLGSAPLGEVLRAWSGLGYMRRARDLHRVARSVRAVPTDPAALDALPGIGAYTAGAVACFSAGTPVAFADTNVRRVLGRVLLGRTATAREALEIDAALLPRRDAPRWHHALMDLGATVCVARAPRCERCPVYEPCRAKGRDPVAPRRKAAFSTSDRRVRGAIMRLLIERGSLTLSALNRALDDGRVPRLVAQLASEGLLSLSGRRASLPEGGGRTARGRSRTDGDPADIAP